MTSFTKLNEGWNAEPNAPHPVAEWSGADLKLRFFMNAFQFKEYEEEDIGEITFLNCAQYRLGSTNDEGWYRGQCRFSGIAPDWGEFYALDGDLKLNQIPNDDWEIRAPHTNGLKHFLFYFRDETFECDAESWKLRIIKAAPGLSPYSPRENA